MTDAAAAPDILDDTNAPAVAPVSQAYRRYALGLLLAIYTANFIDRQIVNILGETIKLDLHISNAQLGALNGLAFALFYTLLGLPIARLAERANRPRIIATAAAIWSLCTMACGAAQGLGQLALARVGVGFGEAGCTPPSHSLISDYVPREKRASAIAFYSLGTPLGVLLGMAMGGLVASHWGWRAAFVVAGAPGLVLGLLAATTLKEPRPKPAADALAAPGVMEALREIGAKQSFWFMALGAAMMAFVGYGLTAFMASFFFRSHAAELAAIGAPLHLKAVGVLGPAMGLVAGVGGMIGTWLGGHLGDRFGSADPRAHVTMSAIAAALGVPFTAAALFAPSAVAALFLLTVPMLTNNLWYGPIYGSVQSLVQARSRATASALILFIANIIGLGLGPYTVGKLNDILSHSGLGEAEGLRWSLLICAQGIWLAVALFWLARRRIRQETVS